MAEVLEYSLVVLVSVLFVGGSVATYGRFSTFLTTLQVQADSASLARAAGEAISRGNTSVVLATPAGTLTCQGGTLQMTSGGYTAVRPAGARCDFAVRLAAGTHRITLGYNGSALDVAAT